MIEANDYQTGRNGEDRFDFAITLHKGIQLEQSKLLLKIFQKEGFFGSIVNDTTMVKSPVLFVGFDDAEKILRDADHFSFLKKTLPEFEIINTERYSIANLTKCIKRKKIKLDPRIEELERYSKFTFGRRHFFYKPGSNKLPQEQNDPFHKYKSKSLSHTKTMDKHESVVDVLKQTVGIGEESDELTNISNSAIQKVQEIIHAPMDKQEHLEEYLSIFTPAEIAMIIDNRIANIDLNLADPEIIKTFNIDDDTKKDLISHKLITVLKKMKFIDFITPLHTQELAYVVNKTPSISYYFGENVSFYFEFMNHYKTWLILPAIFGLFVYFVDEQSHLDSANSPMETLYSIFILFWATLFMIFWERRSNVVSTKNGSYGDVFNKRNMRVDFKWQIRLNYVTELPEIYFPSSQRLLKYILSFFMHLPILIISFLCMIFFLNIRGYIRPDQYCYNESLSNMAAEGGLFDLKSSRKLIATILQVTTMIILSMINKTISIKTTLNENHMTHTNFNNSLIIKRFAFEILNNFTHLAWIAFYRLEILELKKELIALFTIDEIRRITTESLIPYLTRSYKEHKIKVGKTYDEYIAHKLEEISLPEYDSFDDYLEMIIQFGYITLFAASFPLAGFWSLIFTTFELFSDFFKLKTGYRRPIAMNSNGIGSWKYVLNAMCYLCVLTNLIIIAFSSDQIDSLFPSLFGKGTTITKGKGKLAIGILFAIEHFILLTFYILRTLINPQPTWLRIYKERKEYRTKH